MLKIALLELGKGRVGCVTGDLTKTDSGILRCGFLFERFLLLQTSVGVQLTVQQSCIRGEDLFLRVRVSDHCQFLLSMVPGRPNPGLVVRVQDLQPPESPFIVPNQSLRVVGSVERFDAVSGIAILSDGESSLRLDLQHLRELPLRVGSLFEFVGELEINPLHQYLTLKVRVGRNVDGRNMRVFDKVLQLRRRFEKESRTL